MKKSSNPHIGSSFDSWLKEEDIYRQVNAAAIKRVRAWQIGKSQKEQQVTSAEGTSRPSRLKKEPLK